MDQNELELLCDFLCAAYDGKPITIHNCEITATLWSVAVHGPLGSGQTSMGLMVSTWRLRGLNVPRCGHGWNRAKKTPSDSGTVCQL